MESEFRRRIGETVAEILRAADLEDMTEFKVRAAASDRLGTSLSDPQAKKLVRIAVESFLLSASESDQRPRDQTTDAPMKDPNDHVICKLSDRRNVILHSFKGQTMVSFREFYLKDGKQLPSAKGISLTAEQWSSFKQNVPSIEEAIRKVESTLRPELEHVPDLGTDRMEIDRFDGKNYACWSQKMDLFLKQSKIAYVLYELCPSVGDDSTGLNAGEQKWKNDDYTCSRNILSSLSDHLFDLYSKKTMTAKELWEELRLISLFEEHGTKRSRVKKYIEFQMVDERPILEQVQEINDIADSIVADGMVLEEKFHVSVVISKLPSSWKDVSASLMCKEYLPFGMLMNRLGVEEESRKEKRTQPDPEADRPPENNVPKTGGQYQKPQLLNPKKLELQTDGKATVCYSCGKKGHIASNCRSKIWRRDKEFPEKRNVSSGSLPATTDTSLVSGATNS